MAFTSQLMKELANSQPISSLASTPSLMLLEPETEPVIIIDSDLRKITVPDELYNVGVTGDHMAETIYFNSPRYFDGNDLSEHKCIIRYINAGGEYGEDEVVNVEIGTDNIKFGWAIDNYVTRYQGNVSFTVQFETKEQYQWQTTPATVNILAGINVSEAITDKDDILFRTLTNQIQDLIKRVEFLEERNLLLTDVINRLAVVEEKVAALEDNVVYTLDEV